MIILSANINQFVNALSLNGRRTDIGERAALIRQNCAEIASIALKVAEEYKRIYPQREPTMYAGDVVAVRSKELAAANLKRFYENNCTIRLCYEGAEQVGGYVVLSGELLGFHNIRKGAGEWMLRQAIKDGAERLDCFAGHAEALYHKWGFREVLREANRVTGGPDVVFMRKGFGIAPEGRNSGPK
jgi:hypothetical protein